jgi:hypothetical protein
MKVIKKADVFCPLKNNIGFPMKGKLISTVNLFCDALVAKSTVM